MKNRKCTALIWGLLLCMALMFTGCEQDNPDTDDEEKNSHQHTWSEWTVEKQATCDENGVMVRSCECGKESKRGVDPLGHTYTDGICETCGEQEPSEGLQFKSNGDGTCRLTGMGSCRDTVLVIPKKSPEGDLVTAIAYQALSDEKLLESVVIPEGITSIGSYAFYDCLSLREVRLPQSLKTIDDSAFGGCDMLQSIHIPEGVVSIGALAFSSCDALSEVIFPETCTAIGKYAFMYCDSLKKITLPSGLTLISESLFCSSDSLECVEIPLSVTEFGESVFQFCYALTDIVYAGTKEEWHAIYKGYGWDEYTRVFTVHCTDGDIPKEEA